MIYAVVYGENGKALLSYTINPLVSSGTTAKEMLDIMIVVNKAYLAQFKAVTTKLEAKGITNEKK